MSLIQVTSSVYTGIYRLVCSVYSYGFTFFGITVMGNAELIQGTWVFHAEEFVLKSSVVSSTSITDIMLML